MGRRRRSSHRPGARSRRLRRSRRSSPTSRSAADHRRVRRRRRRLRRSRRANDRWSRRRSRNRRKQRWRAGPNGRLGLARPECRPTCLQHKYAWVAANESRVASTAPLRPRQTIADYSSELAHGLDRRQPERRVVCLPDLKGRGQHGLSQAPHGVATVAIHPGWVQTRMGGSAAPLTAEAAVSDMIGTIQQLSIDQSGQFLDRHGEPLPY